MIALILAAIMTSRGVPTTITGDMVTVNGRPGCTVQALYNDPRQPIVVCKSSTLTLVKR